MLCAKVYTGDDIAEEFGVNPSSYEHIKLPNIRAYQARRGVARSFA